MTEHAQEVDRLVRALAGHLRRRGPMGFRRLASGPQAGSPPSAATPVPAQPQPQPQPLPAGLPEAQPMADSPRALPGQATAIPAEPTAPKPPVPSGAPDPAALANGCLNLEQLQGAVAACQACSLHATRTQTVFMDGQAQPGGVFFIGEAPGEQEDRTGTPFVGPAGQLLTDIIEKGMGLRRDQVTIANVLKCRPPQNRDPAQAEKACCTPFLDRQIELVGPAVLVPLGTHAAQHILGTDRPISQLRGRVHQALGRKVVPTYHPAYLLRNPSAKRDCWQDIQLVMKEAGIGSPGQGS